VTSGSGERRRRGRGGASTLAQISAKCGGKLVHVRVWKLGWVLGRSSKRFVGHRRERREVFTRDGNGRRWRKGKLTQGRKGRGFYS
jgi:hypothetical protein